MTNLSCSAERNTFQKKRYLDKLMQNPTDKEALDMVDFYDSMHLREQEREQDAEWRINNLEYDLRSTEWICQKVRKDNVYAQNLYAAMCNNDFQKLDVVTILEDQRWHCSWRYAGGIIADMQQKGDYIDWYCSGISDHTELTSEEFHSLTAEQQITYKESQAFVSESVVTDEIRQDLKKLGWRVVEE